MLEGRRSTASFQAQADHRKTAVLTGGDAQRAYRANASAAAICGSLSALGFEPVLVELGVDTATDLLDSGARLIVDATLDGRVADGAVQELCDALGLTYVGASAGAGRATADKAICSALLGKAGVPVPKQHAFSRSAIYMLGLGTILSSIATELGPQVVVKPRHGHAGLGVRPVGDLVYVPDAIRSAFNYDEEVVVESAIDGRECTVLLSGTAGELWAVGIADVIYDDGGEAGRSAAWARSYAPISPIAADQLQTLTATARRAALAVGCDGLVKVDLIIDAEGTAWVFDVDCTVDWSPAGCLAACVASNDVAEPQLMAALLAQASTAERQAA